MKLSIYNQYVKSENGGIIVYNTKTENVIRIEDCLVENVEEQLLNNASQEIIDMGFLIHDNENEANEAKCYYHEMKFAASTTLSVMLIMTYQCNCACSYCFESLYGNSNNTDSDINRVVEYLEDLYKEHEGKRLELHFFGGEPTLQTDQMVYVFEKLINDGINVIPNVITNGTLLNKENINKLLEAGITSFQITLDGPKNIHDVRRPMKDGSSSWSNIIENLKNMTDERLSISIRVNVNSQNVDSIKEIYDTLPAEIVNHRNFTMYIAPIVGCKIGTMGETLDNRIQNMKRAWNIIHSNKLPILISPPVYAPCPYSSFESAFYLDLEGNVYTCGGFVGKKEKIERVFNERKAEFWERIDHAPKQTCYSCPFFYVCMGGCMYEKEMLGGNCQYKYLKEMHDEYYEKYAEP